MKLEMYMKRTVLNVNKHIHHPVYYRILSLKFRFYGLGLLCLTPLSTIFQLYRGGNLFLQMSRKQKGNDGASCRLYCSLQWPSFLISLHMFWPQKRRRFPQKNRKLQKMIESIEMLIRRKTCMILNWAVGGGKTAQTRLLLYHCRKYEPVCCTGISTVNSAACITKSSSHDEM